MRAAASVLIAIALVACAARSARAQNTPPAGRFEIAAGITVFGTTDFAARDAVLTTATGSSSRLFTTATSLDGTTGFEARVGVRVWRMLEAEAQASYAKPVLTTSVSNDVEGATPVTAADDLTQYTVGGGALWYLRYRPAGRLLPYVAGGVSYLRQLHDGDTLAVTGQLYEFGASAKYFLAPRAGVRGDVRVHAHVHGVSLDDDVHYRPAVSASAFVRF
jgi:opacity protein-like surface antigen